MDDPSVELVSRGDVSIETYVQGDGPTLVVLPSYGRDGGVDFDQFASRLARAGRRVFRPQPRGIGRSKGPMNASLQDMADDVAFIISQLGGGQATVLGHAFGNGVARVLATTHQDLVQGTILAAASTKGASKETNEAPFVAGDLSRPESERLQALQDFFFAPGHDAQAWLTGWYPATLAMQKAAVASADVTSFEKGGVASILQIIAECDPFSPYATWRSMREECGERVTTRIVSDASHALFPEQTAQVTEFVLDWLRRLQP